MWKIDFVFDKIRIWVIPVPKVSNMSEILNLLKRPNDYPIIPENLGQVHPPNSEITNLEWGHPKTRYFLNWQ